MYKILLGSIIAIFAIAPVFGDDKVPELAEPQDTLNCDATDIGATTASARMKASWSPNKYNLEWYDEDSTRLTVQNAAQSCDYGNTLVLPATNPTKLGYTFVGWEIGEQVTGFNYGETCTDRFENSFTAGFLQDAPRADMACLDLNGDGECNEGDLDDNASFYGITEPGQWAVASETKLVVGEALCSSTRGTIATAGTPDTSSDGQNCWCRAMGYKSGDSNMCAVSAPVWVFFHGEINADACAFFCAYVCARGVIGNSDFRAVLFGGSGGSVK